MMGQLSVLGAQRIKALSEMIDEQMAREMSQLITPKHNDTIANLMGEEDYVVFKELKEILNATIIGLNQLSGKTGYQYSTNTRSGYSEELRKELDKVNSEYRKEADEIRKKHTTRKQLLWLCETLEEAKQIVGI